MRKILYLTIFFSFFLTSAYSKTITLSSGEFPPYTSSKDNNGRYIDELVSLAYKSVGIKVNIVYHPWKRSLDMAEKGKNSAGTYPWNKTLKREKSFYLSSLIFEDSEVFFHLKDFDFKWNKLKDLKKYRVGGSRGYYYVEKFKKHGINVDVVNNDLLNYKKLLKGRIDIFPNSIRVGYYQINKFFPPSKADLFTNHKKPMSVGSYYLLISKKRKDGKELIKLFNDGLLNIKKNGIYDYIFDKMN